MSDKITFNCIACSTTVSIDESNPPKDEDVLICTGCGKEFGVFREVKAAMIEAGKAEMDKMLERAFGKKPAWRKG